jgi:hypothetical protein
VTKERIRVYLDSGAKKTFAMAIDWPGWGRSGSTREEALAALVDYGPRYATVAKRAGIPFERPKDVSALQIEETLRGNATTDFGAPGVPRKSDAGPLKDAELKRLMELLVASWETFDAAARKAKGVSLRLGPRGGGRTLPKIADHVMGADEAYLGGLGERPPKRSADAAASMDRLRAAFLAALEAVAHGERAPNPRNTKKPWSPRYAIRRSAWHAMDHAWEIEDRAKPHRAI